MRYLWIHVGIEPIFVWSLSAPRCRWLGRDKGDFDNRFDSFESVLPRHDESNGCAILGRKQPAVQTHGQDRQWIHGLIQAQPLDVGPVEDGPSLAWHALWIFQ